ncbi:cuticle protein, putative [Ixodes scapularis]|uniref:Cuticle protein, putative n=1 Tax=Ixodes scapularis TaxID=6945 RepID=B7PXB2_IXOSC|nr:cuticle protein, putative [Ixodes scapularis]|eukprot:XP_002400047.1 cuticle protein, putative [Ixodes scapularis]
MLVKLIILYMAANIHAEDSLFGPGLNRGTYRGAGYADPVYPSVPFSFGYDTVDEFGTKLFHKEDADASNSRTGSYGYTDANGLFRRVNYVADAGGFRATVDTNEPGTAPGQSADAIFNAKPVVRGPDARATGAFRAPAYGSAAAPTYRYAAKYGYGTDLYASPEYSQPAYDLYRSGRRGYGHHGYKARS